MTNFIEYRTQIRGLARAFPAQASSLAEITALRFFKYVRKQVVDVLTDEWEAAHFLKRLTFVARHLSKCVQESTDDALVQACKISLDFDISALPVAYFFQETLTTTGSVLGVKSHCHIDSKGYCMELSAVSKSQRDQHMIDAFCEKIGVQNIEFKKSTPINSVIIFEQLLQSVKLKSLSYSRAVNSKISEYHKNLVNRLEQFGIDQVDLLLIKNDQSL